MRIFRKEPQQGTNADGKQDLLRHQYEQICQSYYKIEEFRGRLLALWPILGGAAGGIALLASGKLVDYLLPLGIFGGSHYRDSNSKRHRVCIGGHRVAVIAYLGLCWRSP